MVCFFISIAFKHIYNYRYKKPNNSKSKKKIINLAVTGLIFLIKFALILKKFLVAFFVFFIYRPFYQISRLFFYKGFVWLYSRYLDALKGLGWRGAKKNFFQFVFNQKLVHVLVVALTVCLMFVNLTTKTRADVSTDMPSNTILANLVKGEFSEFEEDGQLIVETFDKEDVISPAQQHYLENLSAVRPQLAVDMNSEEEEEFMPQWSDTLVRPDITETKITKRLREGIINYTVKPGDSISTIAEDFEISVNTILWENNLSAYSVIRPGDELAILPVSGLTHKIAKGETLGSIATKYKIEEKDILEANRLADAATIAAGTKIIIPGGKKESLPKYVPKTYTAYTAIKEIVKGGDAEPVAGNKMNWPTDGHRITQYYSWRHTGLDVANKIGTPLYAADSGVVEVAGWGTGYGNQIVIDHGGGKKTRYAHCSKFFVEKGEKVTKGQTIAAMGSTGWSTGSHLHFEVIINNKKFNPLNYIK